MYAVGVVSIRIGALLTCEARQLRSSWNEGGNEVTVGDVTGDSGDELLGPLERAERSPPDGGCCRAEEK